MEPLKTNYVDDQLDISQNTKRKYNMTTNPDGTTSIADATVYKVKGNKFGAGDINATNAAVNTLSISVNGIENTVNTLSSALNGYKLMEITEAGYNALPNKDAKTIYFITEG